MLTKEGGLLCFISGGLPESIRQSLVRNLELSLGGSSENPILKDNQSQGLSSHDFSAIHFSYYARSATNVSIWFVYYVHAANLI